MAITEIKDTDKLIDSVSVLNNNFNYLNNNKANNSTTLSGYGITDAHTKTEADNRYLKLSGGTLTDRLTINRANNTANGAGLLFSGNNQSFAIGVSDTTVTKGVAPTSEKYWGIDFYGKDLEQNNRMGMIEYSINSNNVSTMSLVAFSCVTNTAYKKSSISCSIDGNGNEYTSAPTPATTDNSTKIATTAYVKSNLANYSTCKHMVNGLDELKTLFYNLNSRETQSGTYNTLVLGTTQGWGVFYATKWDTNNGSILLIGNSASMNSYILRYSNGSWSAKRNMEGDV